VETTDGSGNAGTANAFAQLARISHHTSSKYFHMQLSMNFLEKDEF
jgi:hypothetical protein